MKKYYELDLGFSSDKWSEGTDFFDKLFGYSNSAGTGFGIRDMQWESEDRDTALLRFDQVVNQKEVPVKYVCVGEYDEDDPDYYEQLRYMEAE